MATYKNMFIESKSLMPSGKHLFIGSNSKVFLCKKGMVGCKKIGMVQNNGYWKNYAIKKCRAYGT